MPEPIYSIRHVFIRSDPDAVFREVQDVARWPTWATHNVKRAVRQSDGTYTIETPRGTGTIRMHSAAGGILDHEFVDPIQGTWRVPARVAPFLDGALFSMALAKPAPIAETLFAQGMAELDEELQTLKALVEGRSGDEAAAMRDL
jgi:hypothetical protein